MTDAILAVCGHHFVTLRALSQILLRKPATLRNQYLSPLVRERRLVLAFPTKPTHERQAYSAASALLDGVSKRAPED